MNRRHYGTEGEYQAHDYLMGQGYEILEMNYRRDTGEIDIIAQRGDTLAFVEVKRRANRNYGRPAQAVTDQKRRRIVRTAALYMQAHRPGEVRVRFDVIELLPGTINHLEGAFDATGVF